MGNPVEIAVIGTGRMGSLYARLADELAHTRLVAVCGHGEITAASVAGPLGVPGYTGARYGEMLADHPQIEAVIVATSEWAHLDPVLAALEAGKQVLVEKPMATSPEDAARMVRGAEQAGVTLMVCHTLRFDPRFAAMRQAVAEGKIGDVLHLHGRRNPRYGAVDRVLGRFPLAYWLLPHDIDMMVWTTGSPVVQVRAYARAGGRSRRDFILAVLTFASGAVGVLESSWVGPAAGGRLQNPLFTARGTAGAVEVLAYESGLALYGEDTAVYPDMSFEPVVHGQTEGMCRGLVRHFAGAVQGLWAPLITARDGYAVIRVASAIDRSLEEDREIAIPEAQEG